MKPIRLGLLVVLVGLGGLGACTTSPEVARLVENPPGSLPTSINLEDVPFFPQEAYQCGPAALATTLVHSAVAVSPDELVDQVYIPARRGSLQLEMLAAARRYGRIPYPVEPDLTALVQQVSAGRPVLVFQNLGLSWLPQWHYAVAVGYDLPARQLLLRSGTNREYETSLALFEKTWRRAGNWAFVVLAPGEIPVAATPLNYLEAVLPFEGMDGGEIAVAGYLAAIEHWPESPLFRAALGNLYYQQGMLSAARDQFAALVAAHPDFADGHNNLAFVLHLLGEKRAAEQHARLAIELGGPRLPAYQQTLTTILESSPQI